MPKNLHKSKEKEFSKNLGLCLEHVYAAAKENVAYTKNYRNSW